MTDRSKDTFPERDHQWERGWDEHERLQLQRMARLPLSEKLAWLEEAHRLVLRLRASRSSRPEDSSAARTRVQGH